MRATTTSPPTDAPIPLSVHLYGTHVADLDLDRKSRVRLSYTEDALGRWDPNTTPLTLSMPLRDKPYMAHEGAKAFAEGLLPEGRLRYKAAQRIGVAVDDALGMLHHVGRECAGAVVVAGSDEVPPFGTEHHDRLTADRLRDLFDGLDERPLGIDGDPGGVRLSLAGAQPKLLLSANGDGGWALPRAGAPSTHILKPQPYDERFPGLPANEAFCLAVLRHAQVPAADAHVEEIAGRDVLVVERFDRHVRTDGTVERIHQEDFCSAFGMDVSDEDAKYHVHDTKGLSLRRIAATLRRRSVDPPRDLARLADIVCANVVLGNADAHGRNYSMLISPEAAVELAPAYDIVCTIRYDHDIKAAMPVGGKWRLPEMTRDHLLDEVAGWKIRRPQAGRLVDDALDRIGEALPAAADEVAEDGGATLSVARRRLDDLVG